MTGGLYVLLVEVGGTTPTELEVGALGSRVFTPGWYAYVGSAHGAGGFARIERHRSVAEGERSVRHWHLDYLLGAPASTLGGVVLLPGAREECLLARTLPGEPIAGMGASDCDCSGHVLAVRDVGSLLGAIRPAGRSLGQ